MKSKVDIIDKRGRMKVIITSHKELPWEGYSKGPPLFSKEAICLVEKR